MARSMIHLRLKNILSEDDEFEIIRSTFRTDYRSMEVHDHVDYAEVFWVEHGKGIHRVNDKIIPLKEGDMAFVRPSDAHVVSSASADASLTIVNLSFYIETLNHFRERYFPNSEDFFWSKRLIPHHASLDRQEINYLEKQVALLQQKPANLFNLDKILITLVDLAMEKPAEDIAGDMPDWLRFTIKEFSRQGNLAGGASRFVQIACRSRAYVNRTVKRHTGETLSEIVNRVRIQYAAHLLKTTEEKITNIADASGFQNLGYFYRVFNHHYKSTPSDYRKKHRAFLG